MAVAQVPPDQCRFGHAVGRQFEDDRRSWLHRIVVWMRTGAAEAASHRDHIHGRDGGRLWSLSLGEAFGLPMGGANDLDVVGMRVAKDRSVMLGVFEQRHAYGRRDTGGLCSRRTNTRAKGEARWRKHADRPTAIPKNLHYADDKDLPDRMRTERHLRLAPGPAVAATRALSARLPPLPPHKAPDGPIGKDATTFRET